MAKNKIISEQFDCYYYFYFFLVEGKGALVVSSILEADFFMPVTAII